MTTKLEQGRAFVAQVEAKMGRVIDSHIIDLMMDNADTLGFSDDECLEVGNAIRSDKGLPTVAKWWTKD